MADVDFLSRKESEALQLLQSLEAIKDPEAQALTDYDKKLADWMAMNDQRDSAKLNIYALSNGQNSTEEFVETLPIDKYDFEGLHAHIKRKWGAGDYRIRIRDGKKWVINQYLSVREALDEKTTESGMTGVVGQLLEQIRQLNNRPKNDGNERMQFLQEMLIMKQLFSSEQKQSGGITEVLSLITGLKAAGLITTANEEKESEKDGFMGFLSSMAPTLETIAKSALQNRPSFPQQINQPINPVKNEPDFTVMESGELPDNVKTLVSMALITLINAAEKNGDPDLYARWVVDQLPEAAQDDFLDMLESDSWLDTLDAMGYGKAKPHAQWFSQVRDNILAQFDDGGTINDT